MELTAKIDQHLKDNFDKAIRNAAYHKKVLNAHVLGLCPVNKGDLVQKSNGCRFLVRGVLVGDKGEVLLRVHSYGPSYWFAGKIHSNQFLQLEEVELVSPLVGNKGV